MLRATLGGVVIGLMTVAVSAQSSLDCGAAYKGALEKLEREQQGNRPPERLASLRRNALRIYEACRTGDVQDARALFERAREVEELGATAAWALTHVNTAAA